MTETFGSTLEHLRTVLGDQVDGYRRLLEVTRAANGALRAHDHETFDRILAEQVETLRELRGLQHDRERLVREVGAGPADDDVSELQSDLRNLAREVSRASRINRYVIERNGALVDARLGLHRRAGRASPVNRTGVDRFA